MAFKNSGNDEDFYSAMAAEMDEESEVSEADVAAMLADMDDMDDNLFGSSLKPRKGSSSRAGSRASGAGGKDAKDSRPSSKLNSTYTVNESPRGKPDRKMSGTPDSGVIGEEEDLNASLGRRDKTSSSAAAAASPRRQSKPKPKSIDFGDFDEDDPLAGLLSDDDEDNAPKKKPPPKKKVPPKKQEEPKQAETKEEDRGSKKTEDTSPKGTRAGGESRKQSIASPAVSKKKTDDLDFGDDDILDGMGFDDDTPRAEKKKTTPEDKEQEMAKAKVNELFGRSTGVKDKPPAGKKREFILDKKYVKSEPKKEEPKEEDFMFGDYTPSSVGGLGRPESAPPVRRAVRFEDEEDDNMFSTFTRPRSRAGMKATVSDKQKRPHSSADTWRRTSVDTEPDKKSNDDWLELALGSDTKTKPNEAKSQNTKTDGKGKSDEAKKESTGISGKKETEKMDVPITPTPSAAVPSGADYLGLGGDDIDLDTLVTSKPPSPRGQSSLSTTSPKGQDVPSTPTKRDTTSSFPWESSTDRSSGRRQSSGQSDIPPTSQQIKGSTIADDFDDDDDTKEDPMQSSLLANQIAQSQNMQDQGGVPMHAPEPAASTGHKQDIHPRASTAPPHLPTHSDNRVIQPEDLGKPQTNTASPSNRPPSSASRPEPKWRQELRLRQQEQQQQPTSPVSTVAPQSLPSYQPDQSRPPLQDAVHSAGLGPASVSSSTSASIPDLTSAYSAGMGVSSAPVASSMDMVQQMKKKQQELDASMQRQQEQWQAQQQEQMQKFQESQMEAAQQQLQQQMQLQMQQQQQQQQQQQMQQQQMMMNSSMTTPNASSPFPSSAFSTLPFTTGTPMQPSIASISLEAKIQQLEMEKKLVELQLETMQQKHQQQLNALEGAHKDYVQLLEDSSKRRETRLRQETEHLAEQYEGRLHGMVSEQAKLEELHQQRLQHVSQDHTQQIDRIQQGHRQSVDILQRQHQDELQQVQQSLKQELENVTNTQSHSRSLQAVVDQVQATSRELDNFQTRVHGQQQTHIDDRLNELRQKDEQLKVLEKRLSQQQDETSAERTRLEGLVHRLEAHIQQQNTQLDEERWRLRQEQSKLASLQKAAEEERKIAAQQMVSQQATLQQAKDAVLLEQKSIMAQCLEERKALATERAQVANARREVDVALQHQADKVLQTTAEQEGKMESLASERSQLAMQTVTLKQHQQSLEEGKQRLREQQEQIDSEKSRLQSLAETLRKKSQQMQDTIHEAVTTRNEGELALNRATRTEAEHTNRLRTIQHQIQILRATEKHIAQERLDLAQEQRRIEKLRKSVRCVQCGGGVGGMSSLTTTRPSDANITTLPSTLILGSPQVQSTPITPSRGDPQRGLQEVIAKVEMDTSIHMWKTAADKDKDFLDEESAYLETLRSPMRPSVRVQ